MEIVQEPVVEMNEPAQERVSNPTNPIFDPKPEPIGEQKKEEPKAEEPKPEEPKEEAVPKGVQKRIDRAVRQKYEAEARAKMLEERLEKLERMGQTQPQQQHIAQNDRPTIDKFDNFDDYVAATAEWIADQKIQKTLTEREKQQAAEREAAERTKTVESWNKRLAQATVEMPDFEDVVASSDVPVTPPVQQAIMESDVGPKLAYYLASHPDEASAIAAMAPIGAIRALGRLEERLASQKPNIKPTSAPEPIKPVGTRAAVSKDPGKMSDAEYAKWRKSGRAA